jgi:hypothetical protein
MFDMYESRDLDRYGAMDLISPRGNSGDYDGVFWLEQVGPKAPVPSFTPARTIESPALPLPPANWLDFYPCKTTHIAPKKDPAGP